MRHDLIGGCSLSDGGTVPSTEEWSSPVKRSLWRALAAACVLTLFVTACGDDDDTTTAGGDAGEESASGDLDGFCGLMEELDSQEAPPATEQMEQIKELRPEEIGAEIDYVADAFIDAEGDMSKVFADPEVEAKFEAVDAYTAENCPGMEHLAEDEGEGDVDPEFAAYCEASDALGQGGPPTAAQIEELIELAPDAISTQAGIVGDALEAADGDVEATFTDPEAAGAIGEIEAWESENCGGGEEGEDGDLEAAEGAEVVPVTGVDFAFEGVPDTVASGPVALEFTNEGESVHEMALFSLGDKSVDQVISDTEAAFEDGNEDSIEDLGYAFTPPGAEPRYVNAELEPGEYVLICFIPGPEGKPHYELGMQQTFTVG